MLRQTTRKIAIIATVVFTCVAVAACGSTGSAGNDAIRAKEVAATRAVVTTAAEKTEATTTTSSTETTTSKPKTTTTTTAATTTAEPEKTEEVTTTTEPTTTTVATTAEPEITETEATTAEEPEETGIVTMADNPEGMYPMSECFRRKVEEYSGSVVVSIGPDPDYDTYLAVVEDGRKYVFACDDMSRYENDEITSINEYILSEYSVDGRDGVIVNIPKT